MLLASIGTVPVSCLKGRSPGVGNVLMHASSGDDQMVVVHMLFLKPISCLVPL
jgi:hypothetical protein